MPGFDASDPNLTCVVGSAGVADPNVSVTLINDGSGVTVTTDSTSNGSFKTFIRAHEEDLLSAHFVNQNGTTLVVPLELQRFDDGSVGLYGSGGLVEAENPLGGAPLALEIEPGSIARRVKMKLTGQVPAEVVAASGAPAEGEVIFGGVIEYEGETLTAGAHYRFPMSESDLHLASGQAPSDAGFVLTRYRTTEVDGEDSMLFEVVDRMLYEDGALVTHSPPFDTTLGAGEYNLAVLTLPASVTAISGLVLACSTTDSSGTCGVAGDRAAANGDPFAGVSGRRLPGAIVFTNPGGGAGVRPGALRSGQIVAVSDRHGKYALAVPGLSGFLGLRATHYEFPGVPAYADARLAEAGSVVHVIFDEDTSVRVPQPPLLTMGHSPERPSPWVATATQTSPGPSQEALVVMVAEHESELPEIADLRVEDITSLVTGQAVTAADVTFGEATMSTSGTARTKTVPVTCARAALVRLRARATAEGRSAELLYPIYFGGTAAPATNPDPTPQRYDTTGPLVERSWPPQNAIAVSSQAPIVLEFNEPISQAILGDTTPIQVVPEDGQMKPSVSLSQDQRRLEILVPWLKSDRAYTLTLASSGIHGLDGRELDQDPSTPLHESYVLRFRTEARPENGELTGLAQGGGAVVNGSYAFVLDRITGTVKIYDISDPTHPKPAPTPEVMAPNGVPRDLVLIPRYSYVRPTGDPRQPPCTGAEEVVTRGFLAGTNVQSGCLSRDRTLLAVIGGEASLEQRLTIFDVTNVNQIRTVATLPITARGTSAVNKLIWSAPALAYLERTAFAPTVVSIVDLQTFIFGYSMTAAQFETMPDNTVGTPGVDQNGDGDYVDAQDTLPMPPKPRGGIVGAGFVGRRAPVRPYDTDQDIIDYDFYGPTSFVAAVLTDGTLTNGPAVPAEYRTLSATDKLDLDHAALYLPRALAAFSTFPGIFELEAVAYFPALRLRVREGEAATDPFGGHDETLDVSIVGARGGGADPNESRLFLLDVSDPRSPRILGSPAGISLPGDFGLVERIERDPLMPGVIRVTTANDAVLLDVDRLTMGDTCQGDRCTQIGTMHPSVMGVTSGVGSSRPATGSTTFGVNVVTDFRRVVFTGPEMMFVSFPSEGEVVSPHELVDLPDMLEPLFAGMEQETDLRPARYGGPDASSYGRTSHPSDLLPGAPAVHYHVAVFVPGSAGTELDLLLESLNAAGYPLANTCQGAPARGASATTLTQADLPVVCDSVAVRPLKARRLSDDPSSRWYDVYLSDPFALVYEKMTNAQVTDLRTLRGQPREIYLSGAGVRVSLDPSLATRTGAARPDWLVPFASKVACPECADGNSVELHLGRSARATSYLAHRLLGPNPRPVTGSVRMPGTAGMVAAHNGALEVERTDLALPSPQMPIAFSRTYIGQDLYQGPLGPGWDFTYNQRVVELGEANVPAGARIPLVLRGAPSRDSVASSSDVVLHDGRGNLIRYARLEGTAAPAEYASDPLLLDLGFMGRAARWYRPQAGVFDALLKLDTGDFVRVTPGGTQYWYGASGRLEKVFDRYESNRHELVYTERGELRRNHQSLGVGEPIPGDRVLPREPRSALRREPRRPRLGGVARKNRAHPRLRGPNDHVPIRPRRAARRGGRRACGDGGDRRPDGLVARDVRLGCRPGDEVGDGRRDRGRGDAERDALRAGGRGGRDARRRRDRDNHGAGAEPGRGPRRRDREVDGGRVGRRVGGVHVQRVRPPAHRARVRAERGGGDDALRVRERGASEDHHAPAREPRRVPLRHRRHASPFPRQRPPRVPRRPRARVGHVRDDGALRREVQPPSGAQRDFEGKTSTVTLENDGRDVAQVEYEGASTSAHHDGATGQLLSQTDIHGITETYTYEAATGFLSTEARGTASTTYGYASCSGGALGLVCRRTVPSGLEAAELFSYDEAGRLISMSKGSYETTIGRNRNGDPLTIRRTVDAAGAGGATTSTEDRIYDQLGDLRTKTLHGLETNGAPADLTWTYAYDTRNRLHEIQAPEGTTVLEYDHRGRVFRTTRGDRVEEVAYDTNGNVTERRVGGALVESRQYDGFDRSTVITDTEGGRFEYTYDENDDLRTEVVTDTQYGTLSRTNIQDRDGLGRALAWTYAGGLSAMRASYASSDHSMSLTGPESERIITRLDDAGRLAHEELEGVYTKTQTFDDADRPRTLSSAEGSATFFGAELDYSDLGHLENIRDLGGAGTPVRVRFDNRTDGYAKAVTIAPETEDVRTETPRSLFGEPLGRTSRSGVTNLIELDRERRPSLNGLAHTEGRHFFYDASNRLERIEERGGLTWTANAYDAFGSPTSVSLPGDGTARATYDALGRLATTTHEAFNRTDTATYDHDALGRLRRTTFESGDVSGSVDTGYDLLGVATTATLTASVPVDGQPQTERFAWGMDPYRNGAPHNIHYPSGESVTQTRSAPGRLTSMITLHRRSDHHVDDLRHGERAEHREHGHRRPHHAHGRLRRPPPSGLPPIRRRRAREPRSSATATTTRTERSFASPSTKAGAQICSRTTKTAAS